MPQLQISDITGLSFVAEAECRIKFRASRHASRGHTNSTHCGIYLALARGLALLAISPQRVLGFSIVCRSCRF